MLTRGLKNWVVEDGRSIEAAMADARRDEERTLASAQLEAFHQTFNFCMDCRQYTCTDCWNQAEGRCLSCAPMPGQVEAEAAAVFVLGAPQVAPEMADVGTAWPTSDLDAEDVPAPIYEAPEVAAAAVAVDDGIAATATADAPDAAAVPLAAVPYVPTDLRPVELPDDDIDILIGAADANAAADVAVEPEPALEAPLVEAAAQPAPEPEPKPIAAAAILAAATEPMAAEAEKAEPIAAEAEQAEPIAAEAEQAEPIAAEAEEPEPIAAAVPPPAAPVTAPAQAWTMVAPDVADGAPTEAPAWPPRTPVYQPPVTPPNQPSVGQPGQAPAAQPAWPTVPSTAFTVPAAQGVWEESSLSVISRPGSGVQACVSCGLPLSATARFCRRCGSRQG